MPEHSKIAGAVSDNLYTIITQALVGSDKKKAFSIILLAIVGYLIYMKNKKSSTDNIKIKESLLKKVTHRLLRI